MHQFQYIAIPIFDGRTGESTGAEVAVGNSYVLKLVHMVEDKLHAPISIHSYSHL
jgi:DNA-directed RNA polymerase beta subunit